MCQSQTDSFITKYKSRAMGFGRTNLYTPPKPTLSEGTVYMCGVVGRPEYTEQVVKLGVTFDLWEPRPVERRKPALNQHVAALLEH